MSEVFGAVLSIKDNVSGVMKQARDSAKGYRGEVQKVKGELDRLNKQKIKDKEIKVKNSAAYKAIDGVMKKLQPIKDKVVNIQARAENAQAKIKKVQGQLGKIKENKVVQLTVKGAANVTKALGKAAIVGTAAALTTITVAAGAAVTQAAAFQSQMQNVGTLLDGDVNAKLQTMGSDLKKVSIDTGIATSDLSDGLYQVVSAFGESADSVKQLEIAAKAAKAGNATTTDSVNMLSAVTKGYGDTSAEAMQKASDLAFMTVKLGQTSFPELAASMGQVVPLASTLKVSQEELFGAMSTLTGVTGSTSEVTTQLKATMQSFLSPSTQMEKTLKQMGYSSGAAALEAEGLGGILSKLSEEVGGDQVAFANLFSSVEAKNAVLALTGAQAENFASKTAAMSEASGAAQKAFDTQTASVSAMADKLKNAGGVMLTSLGEQALPYIQQAVEGLVDKLPAITETLGGVIQKAGPVIGSLVGKIQAVWTEWKPVLSQIGEQFAGTFGAVQGCIGSMLESWNNIVPYVQPIVTTFTGVIAAAIPAVTPIFSGLSSVVAAVFPVISQIIQDAGGKVGSIFSIISSKTGTLQQIFAVAGPAIATVLSTAWSVISPIMDLAITGVGLVADAIGWAFPYIQGIIESVWNVIGPVFEAIGSGIGVVAEAVKKIIGGGGSSGGGSGRSGGVAQNATGTPFFTGGWTTVGEHGPELMRLPAGTQIQSNQSSNNFQSGGARPVNVYVEKMEVRNDDDPRRVAEELAKKIEEAEDNM